MRPGPCFDDIGIAEIMKAHQDSLTCESAEMQRNCPAGKKCPLGTIDVDRHRNGGPSIWMPMAIYRSGLATTGRAATDGMVKMVDSIMRRMEDATPAQARKSAIAALATMVGAFEAVEHRDGPEASGLNPRRGPGRSLIGAGWLRCRTCSAGPTSLRASQARRPQRSSESPSPTRGRPPRAQAPWLRPFRRTTPSRACASRPSSCPARHPRGRR